MLTSVEKLMFLRAVPTFAGCEIDALRRFADAFVVQRFEAGEVIVREGEPGQHLYVVTEGRVDVTVGGRHLNEVGPRQYFGEMALFDGGPRSATATAIEATTLLRLDRDDFYRLGRESPDLLIGVIRVISERLRAVMARAARP
jgi:CRP/FNR family cyclic AMP-dependent transcriptional regulator